MSVITKEELENAALDAETLEDVANGDENTTVTSREGQDIKTVAKAIAEISTYDDKGPWVTATTYAVKDLVQEAGATYICLFAHTSGVFATDYAADKWGFYQGIEDHASTHTDGTDDIQDATASQKGLATAAQVTKIDALVKNNFTSVLAPTTGDDSDDGYAAGSVWLDVLNDRSYTCVDAAVGAAVWVCNSGLTKSVIIIMEITDSVATVQAKIDRLPKHVGAGVTSEVTLSIRLADGVHTWSTEGLVFRDFQYPILILGDIVDSTLSTTKSVMLDASSVNEAAIDFVGCSRAAVAYMKITHNDAVNASAVRSEYGAVEVRACYMLGSGTVNASAGVECGFSNARVEDTYFSDQQVGILAGNSSTIFSKDNDDTGTEPLYGLSAKEASTIGKDGTQPDGSTLNELGITGGVIR